MDTGEFEGAVLEVEGEDLEDVEDVEVFEDVEGRKTYAAN